MATNARYAPVHVPRPHRSGPKPVLDDPEIRRTMLNMAAAGASRKAIARRIGINPSRLREWIAKGDAQPDIEPWASFSREFLDAERMLESTITGGQAQQVRFILSKPPKERSPWELDFLGRILAARFPAEHGSAAAGNGQLRVIEQDIDPEAWWAQQGLVGDQLRTMLRDPDRKSVV